jgi:glycosyltransferase involved in cell wall biosynthesis
MIRTVYFYRKYNRFTGGHLKVWDYFNHTQKKPGFMPYLYLAKCEEDLNNTLWTNLNQNLLQKWNPYDADVLFLAGMDWYSLPEPNRKNWSKPVINLIQSVRHALPETPLYDCLSNHAIRICVSPEVANSILATGKVNGPVFIIPNGIDYSFIKKIGQFATKDVDLLIAGLKDPIMANALRIRLGDLPISIQSLTVLIPRTDFLRFMANSKIVVFLPTTTEGFYLPAIEGMAVGAFVICPDCIGNRSFCFDLHNCRMPVYSVDKIFETIVDTLKMNDFEFNKIKENANKTAINHSLEQEQTAYHSILQQLDSLWN